MYKNAAQNVCLTDDELSLDGLKPLKISARYLIFVGSCGQP